MSVRLTPCDLTQVLMQMVTMQRVAEWPSLDLVSELAARPAVILSP
jgi:hypothetical protein